MYCPCIKRRTVTPLPNPPNTISRVYDLSDKYNQNPDLDFCVFIGNPIEDASLAHPTITAHDANIARVNETGIKNAGVDQLVNENQNYEIAGVEYVRNGEISVVDENTPEVGVDIPLKEIPGVDPETFEEEFVEDENNNAAM